jgi:hypothetical protein
MVLTRITNYMQGREGIRICIAKIQKETLQRGRKHKGDLKI